MKRFAITLVTLFALAAMSVPAEAANNNWDLAKSPSRPSVSGFRTDGGNANVNNGNFNGGNVTNVSRHHHHGSSYGRSSYPYGGYGYGGYPAYGYRNYGGYGGYGYYNSGIPAASFANPTAYGFGPGAVFGW